MHDLRKRLAAAATLLCILLTSCAREPVITQQHDRVEITLSWWGNDARTEYTIEGVRYFEELHPDIKVNISYSEWSGYEARNRIQMASSSEADVMQVNFGWLSEFSPDGEGYYDIEKLSDYIDFSNFEPDMLDYGRRGGVLNAIPIAMNTESVYINKTIYDKYGLDIPETWEDFENAAKVMSPDGVYPISGSSKSMWLYTVAYAEQVTGNPFLREDGNLNFTPRELQIMLEFYARMVKENVFPQVEYYDRLNLESGTYAGTIAWVSDAKNYYGKAIEAGNEIVVAPYTHDASHQCGDGWYAKPATLYAISKHTDHPKEAAMLLDFLLNDQEMAVMQGVEKGVPLSSSARDALHEQGMLSGLQYDASLFMEENKNIQQMNPFIENSDLLDSFIACCNLVVYEKSTPEEAAMELFLSIKKHAAN